MLLMMMMNSQFQLGSIFTGENSGIFGFLVCIKAWRTKGRFSFLVFVMKIGLTWHNRSLVCSVWETEPSFWSFDAMTVFVWELGNWRCEEKVVEYGNWVGDSQKWVKWKEEEAKKEEWNSLVMLYCLFSWFILCSCVLFVRERKIKYCDD